MAARTHELFSALANPQRLAILAYLIEREEPVRQNELLGLDELAGLRNPQSTASHYLRALASQGLVVKDVGKRGAFTAPMRATTSRILEDAAAIHEEYFAASALAAAELRRRMRKADMARLPDQRLGAA